jgi:hypothetical protein
MRDVCCAKSRRLGVGKLRDRAAPHDRARPYSLSRVAGKLPVCCLDTSCGVPNHRPKGTHPLTEARSNDVGTRVLAPTDSRVHHPVLLDALIALFSSAGIDRRREAARDRPLEGVS